MFSKVGNEDYRTNFPKYAKKYHYILLENINKFDEFLIKWIL